MGGGGAIMAGKSELSAKARERLAKLVGMLTSSNDVEVLGAARAINNTLKAAGADINDLIEIVKGDAPKPSPEIGVYSKKNVYLRMVEICLVRSYLHDDKTRQFLRHMQLLLENGRLPSQAQTQWLVDIYARGV